MQETRIGMFTSVANAWSGGPFIESAHDLHEPKSQQDDRAPQYERNAVEYEMLPRTGQLKHSYLHDCVHVRCEISSHQTAHYQVVHVHTPPFSGLHLRAGTRRLDKPIPETLTTACHAASWLARSWRCGWRCASIGPGNFP